MKRKPILEPPANFRLDTAGTDFLPLPAGFKMSPHRAEQARQAEELRRTTHTFNEWSDMSYKISKGSKSVGRNAKGVCLFSGAQVEYVGKRNNWTEEYEDLDVEYDPDLPGNPDDYGHSD